MARPASTGNRGAGVIPVPPSRGHRASKPRKTGTSAFPLLPALAATLLLLGAGQATLWWLSGRLPGAPEYTRSRHATSFTSATTPAAARPLVSRQRLDASPLSQNIQFGDAMGRVRVTLFTDPACGACRQRVQELTANLPVQGVRQVYKFWPSDPRRTTPGLLLELARREAVIPAFWKGLQAAGDADLSDIDLLQLLEQAGLPLSEQRAALSHNSAELATALTPDLATARRAELPPPPVVMVDDRVLDTPRLTPTGLAEAVQKRLEGRPLAREDQLWMMTR